ncbi:MAG: DUF2255 family protein [Deltaproteobacteria bacterium]|nr:DUF2255 family protein [Deltaproteobacteria bacterium]MBW2383778.1 DUF2255 family protein [Deltaproteobacteria bacterium]
MSVATPLRIHVFAIFVCVGTALLASTLAVAAEPDWASLADVKQIHALTKSQEGKLRETKIWLAVVDGQGYLRTSRSTRWGKNVVRDPEIVVRIEDVEYPVHITFVEDDALRERVIDAFREKYGGVDWWLQVFRGRSPQIMRVDPRARD